MPGKSIMAVLIIAIGPVVAAAAEEAPAVVRGTDGLAPVSFEARNETAGPIACGAAIAHWYSLELGRADPGRSVRTTLWSDPRTGAVFALNDLKDRMPVAGLWCGLAGRDVSTGARIALQRRSGAPEPAVAVACRQGAGKTLDCRPQAGP